MDSRLTFQLRSTARNQLINLHFNCLLNISIIAAAALDAWMEAATTKKTYSDNGGFKASAKITSTVNTTSTK